MARIGFFVEGVGSSMRGSLELRVASTSIPPTAASTLVFVFSGEKIDPLDSFVPSVPLDQKKKTNGIGDVSSRARQTTKPVREPAPFNPSN